jgi:hypothetical protein
VEGIGLSLAEQESLLFRTFSNKDHIFDGGHLALPPEVEIVAVVPIAPLRLLID